MVKKIAMTALVLVVTILVTSEAMAETREFLIVTGEPSWQAKPGEAPVADRDRGLVKKMERYTFHPGFLVVNRGDKVVLKIHDIKGDKHIVTINKDAEVPIFRGELLARGGSFQGGAGANA